MVSDSHAHLDMADYASDRDQVIERARRAGLKWIITVAMLTDGAEAALDLAASRDFIRAVVGLHPHDASAWSRAGLEQLEKLARRPVVVGLGEIGLDFYRDYSPREKQEAALIEQLLLAGRLKLPVVIHDRRAHDRIRVLLEEHGRGLAGVFHCFSGDWNLARWVLDLGFYISVPGVITFNKAEKLREVVKAAPLDRLLVETDCPFLAPAPYRGQRNEPAYVVETARAVARVKGLSYEEVAAQTTANLERLFHLPVEP